MDGVMVGVVDGWKDGEKVAALVGMSVGTVDGIWLGTHEGLSEEGTDGWYVGVKLG
jgi:hypothetical protein